MNKKELSTSEHQNTLLSRLSSQIPSLDIKNADSSILQSFSLNTPYSVLVETCRKSEEFFEFHEISSRGSTVIHPTWEELSIINQRPLHQHSFLEIMYVLDGNISMYIEHQTFCYTAGQYCVMNRNIRHSEILSGDYTAAFFMFQDAFAETLLTNYYHELAASGVRNLYRRSNAIFQLIHDHQADTRFYEKIYLTGTPVSDPASAVREVSDLLNQILRESEDRRDGYTFYIRGAFTRLFQILTDEKLYTIEKSLSRTGRQDILFTEIARLMEESHGHCTREELSEKLHYTGEYINKIIKLYTGKTLSEYRQMIFLEEAKNLLLYSDMSMTDIIGMLGLSNRSYFYRLFKKAYGMTPVEYREAHRR